MHSRWELEKLSDSKRCGSLVHLSTQNAAWLAKLDRVITRYRGATAWEASYLCRPSGVLTACAWKVEHFSRVLDYQTEGLTDRVMLKLIKTYVNCPHCLVLVDAILETRP